MWLVVWGFVLLSVTIAIVQPFPTGADELEHLSMVRTQYDRPAVFPDYAEARILDPHMLGRFSNDHNYINHPSLYYWLMAQVMRSNDTVVTLRLANVGLAVAALVIIVVAGMRLFADPAQCTIFAALAASFPKAAPIAGSINNDNLATLAGACVFAGLAAGEGGTGWLAAGLAIAGWSKLTALIALGSVTGGTWFWRRHSGGRKVWSSQTGIVAVGAVIGAVPYIANLVTLGVLLPVDTARYFVAPAERLDLGFAGFLGYFFEHLVTKWSATEGVFPVALAALFIGAPLAAAAIGFARRRSLSAIGIGYAVGVAITLAVHVAFGWRSYTSIGDLTIAQTRYYNVLWPGVALGGAIAVGELWRRSRIAAGAWVVLYLMPTALGSIMLAYL